MADHSPSSNCSCLARQRCYSKVVSTDPPYYDNIGYADLSDFFYVWLRRSLKPVFPDLFATLAVPKAEELVATPYRHGSKEKAEAFFLDGMTRRCTASPSRRTRPSRSPSTTPSSSPRATSDDGHRQHRLGDLPRRGDPRWLRHQRHLADADGTEQSHDRHRAPTPSPPASSSSAARAPPMRPPPRAASSSPRSRPSCPRRSPTCSAATSRRWTWRRRPSARAWRSTPATPRCSTPRASRSRCARRWRSSTRPSTRRWPSRRATSTPTAAGRWPGSSSRASPRASTAWPRQLSKAKNTSVAGMVEAGILASKRGKVRLLRARGAARRLGPGHRPAPHRLGDRPPPDPRARSGGEGAAAELVAKLGAKAEIARELAYRLYTLCERKKRAAEALAYNGLVQSWPEIIRLAREGGKPQSRAGRRCSRRSRSKPWPSPTTNASARRWSCSATGSRPSSSASSRASTRTQAAEAARRYFGDDRLRRQEADRRVGRGGAAQADVGGVERRLPQDARPRRAHRWCSELRDCRNKWAHQEPFSSDDADRALDSMARLLTAVSAPQADEVGKMKMELRRLTLRRAGAQREAQGRRLADRGGGDRHAQALARGRHAARRRGERALPAGRVRRRPLAGAPGRGLGRVPEARRSSSAAPTSPRA